MLTRLPIKVSAPLLVGIPVLIVGVWLSVMWNRQSRQSVTDLADRNIEQIHNMAATKVADVLSIPVRVCELNAHLVRSGALPPADLHAWRPLLVRQAQAFDMLSAITWGSADGRSAWVARYADGSYYWALKEDASAATMVEWRLDEAGSIPDEPTNTFDFNLDSRPWFQAPRQAGEPTWSDPFVWVGGADSGNMTLGISYGIPIYEPDGALVGIIDADFSLNDLSAFLGSIRVGKTGVAVLATGDGGLLAVSNDSSLFSPEGDRFRVHDSPDPLIAAAAGFVGDPGSARGVHRELHVDGAVHHVRSSPIGREVGLDWALVTIVPEQDFLGEIDAGFQRSWVGSLLAVALAIAVGLGAARWLVSPLIQLVAAVRRIGEGDLETTVEIHHAPEYTKLGDEINDMALGLQDRLRMRTSLNLAREVQKNLLPSRAPSIPGLDIAGHSTYCDETGGDYYDYLDVSGTDEETAVIAVGDVMGHGVAAAMLMATARGILRSRTSVPGSLADFLEHLNNMLVPDTRGQRFMTMLLMTLGAPRHQLRWASAGHGPPIIYDANTDSFPELDGGGVPLGIMADHDYEEYVQPGIGSGCLILAATDGLWETMAPDGTAFGMERLRALIRKHAHQPAAEISNAMRDALAAFCGPNGQDDDLTFVIAKVV